MVMFYYTVEYRKYTKVVMRIMDGTDEFTVIATDEDVALSRSSIRRKRECGIY